MAEGPIFVIGTPRSGTTLTAKILGRHPRIFMPGETHYIDDIFSSKQLRGLNDRGVVHKIAEKLHTIYDRYYESEDQKRIEKLYPLCSDLENTLQGCKCHGDILNQFMSLQMESVSKFRWGNNAPRDLFSYKEIYEIFPNAKFVICIRDIRAFLLSYQGKWKVVNDKNHVERMKKMYHPVVTSYLWKSSARQIELLEKTIPSTGRIIVRYEDLVSDPEATTKKICEMIEEEFDPSMLEVTTHNSSNASHVKGIFSTSVDRWLTSLTPEEIAIGQSISSRELRRFGYSKIETSPNYLRVFYYWLSTPAALWKALEANRNIRGPIIPYLLKRVGVLLRTWR